MAQAGGEEPGKSWRKVARHEHLFDEGDAFRCFYLVRLGTFKSMIHLRNGCEQVTGFQIGGELLGMDGLATGRHASAAVALEDSEVICIPYQPGAFGGGTSHDPVPALLSREIVREQKLMLLLGGGMDAHQRLASFLLNLSRRMAARGYCGTEFHLRMTRADIGSYLGLKLETVSRSFSAFSERGWLKVHGRHVKALDRTALRQLFGPTVAAGPLHS